jgi:hypothetical protein
MNPCTTCDLGNRETGYRGLCCPILTITPDKYRIGCSEWQARQEDCPTSGQKAETGTETQKRQTNVATVNLDLPERKIQALCEGYLRQRDIWGLHLSPRAREKIGCPDLLFSVRGVPVAVEIKTEHGKVTPDQARTHDDMRRNGWQVHVVRSVGEFVEVVRKYQYGKE